MSTKEKQYVSPGANEIINEYLSEFYDDYKKIKRFILVCNSEYNDEGYDTSERACLAFVGDDVASVKTGLEIQAIYECPSVYRFNLNDELCYDTLEFYLDKDVWYRHLTDEELNISEDEDG